MTRPPKPSAKAQVLKVQIDAVIAFNKKASYLSHPDVPYRGTVNGDSEEKWQRRYIKAMLECANAAANLPKKGKR